MAETHPNITDDLRLFIERQHVFFVATAPLSGDGHINVSPKGLDCFRVLSPTRVCYLDITGSGNETSAHLYENGRVTFLFCAFDGPPKLLRLYGRGETVLPGTTAWDELRPLFGDFLAARQIIAATIDLVRTSCGYGVPLMDFADDRDQMHRWARAKGEDGVIRYRAEHNVCSLDSLPTPLGVQLGLSARD